MLDVRAFANGPLTFGRRPDEAFLRAIDYSLEVEDQVSYGETVQMKLRLRNVSDDPITFHLGGRPPHDFEVSTARRRAGMALEVRKIHPHGIGNGKIVWNPVRSWSSPASGSRWTTGASPFLPVRTWCAEF